MVHMAVSYFDRFGQISSLPSSPSSMHAATTMKAVTAHKLQIVHFKLILPDPPFLIKSTRARTLHP